MFFVQFPLSLTPLPVKLFLSFSLKTASYFCLAEVHFPEVHCPGTASVRLCLSYSNVLKKTFNKVSLNPAFPPTVILLFLQLHCGFLLYCVVRYESVIATLCENLDSLDEPEARAAMIWIVGEYAERIDNADELLESFLEGFHDESTQVKCLLKCPLTT